MSESQNIEWKQTWHDDYLKNWIINQNHRFSNVGKTISKKFLNTKNPYLPHFGLNRQI